MSQFVLDEQLFERAVEKPIARWAVVSNLHHLRPNEVIKDDRVSMILRQLKYPTFITIDMAFWNPRLRHPKYCILCFPFRNDEQELIPDLLRRLLRFPEFRSIAKRHEWGKWRESALLAFNTMKEAQSKYIVCSGQHRGVRAS